MAPVTSAGRGSEANDVPRLHLVQHPLERERRKMVALVHDDLPVSGHPVVHRSLPTQALQHGDVESPVGLLLAPADDADLLLVDPQEHRQLGDPLVEKLLPVHEDEGAPAALGDQVRAEDGLPEPRRRHEDPDVVLEHGFRRGLLDRRELALEGQVVRLAHVAFVLDRQLHPVLVEERLEVDLTPSGDGDVIGEVLRAGDDPGRATRGQPHALLLVEVRILERGEPLYPVEQRRGNARLPDEEALRQDRVQLRREGASHPLRTDGAGRRRHQGQRMLLDEGRGKAGHTGEMAPLVGPRVEAIVEEERVPLLHRLSLERQGDEVSEAPARHRVLVREEPVVGLHPDLVAATHGLGEKVGAHPPGHARGDGSREEKPHVGTFTGARPFHRRIRTGGTAGFDEGGGVLPPRGPVEVGRQESAGLVLEHRVDADDVAAVEVVQDDLVPHRKEFLVRALPTLHALLVAEGPVPLVRAGGGVALLPLGGVLPVPRVDVLAAAEEFPEDPKLGRVGESRRRGGGRPRRRRRA